MAKTPPIARPILCQPGITTKEDATPYSSTTYIDGEHCRFYGGKPKKIGGRLAINFGEKIIARTLMGVVNSDKSINVYVGRYESLKTFNVNIEGNTNLEVDRTPTDFNNPVPGKEANQRLWNLITFSGIYSGYTPPSWSSWFERGTPQTYVIGVAPYILNDITDNYDVPVYFGPVSADPANPINLEKLIRLGTTAAQTDPLSPAPPPSSNELGTSGGIIGVGSFLMAYGASGTILWNGVDTYGNSDFYFWPIENQKSVGNTKIVTAQSTLAGTTPGVLFWTLDSLIRGTLTNIPNIINSSPPPPQKYTGTVNFSFTTVQSGLSILSSNCVLSYSQTIFWPGINTFYMYVGIVQTLHNNETNNFFFNNLNFKHQQKVFGIVLQRYNELWWIWVNRNAPGGQDQPGQEAECNWAVVYNVKEQKWFHTPWYRAAAVVPGNLPYPIMSGSDARQTSAGDKVYPIWFEEYRFDEYFELEVVPIRSFFQTNLFCFFRENPQADFQMEVLRVETDFVQAGEMSLEISTQSYITDSPTNFSQKYYFEPNTGKIDVRVMGRLITFKFESYTLGGDYQMGTPTASIQPGDFRP